MWTRNDARDAAELAGPRILRVEVEKAIGYANRPTWTVYTDRQPEDRDFLPYTEYPVLRGTRMFIAYGTGGGAFVRYLLHNPENEHGYGGRLFRLPVVGGVAEIVGPWSSRAAVVNALPVPFPVVDVTVRSEDGTLASLAVRADALFRRLPEGFMMLEEPDDFGVCFTPVREDGRCVKCGVRGCDQYNGYGWEVENA